MNTCEDSRFLKQLLKQQTLTCLIYSTSRDASWSLNSGIGLLALLMVATARTPSYELSKWLKTYWPFTWIWSFCSVATSHRNGLVSTTERRKPLCIITLVCWQAVLRAKHLHTSLKPYRSRARVLAHNAQRWYAPVHSNMRFQIQPIPNVRGRLLAWGLWKII